MAALPGTSNAATIGTFTSCSVGGGCGTASSFGTIDFNSVTNIYTVTLSGNFEFFGSGNSPQPFFAFNTTSGTPVFGTITVQQDANPPLSAGLAGVNGTTPPGNPPGGIGSMDNYISTTTTNLQLGNTLQFALTGTYTLGPNGGGVDTFAADVCTNGVGGGVQGCPAGSTGWIDATLNVDPVPLPGALPLFASGLVGLGLLGWRRKLNGKA
jgi:hypothetical protein